MKKAKIVFDTNIFVNPDARGSLGKDPTEALHRFLVLAHEHRKRITCYIPPSVLEELLSFVEKNRIPENLFSAVTKVSPERYRLVTPSLFFYELIEEMRDRINKGLRIAEKFTRKALENGGPEGDLIKTLREEYKTALREGIIDSVQDVDLLCLSYQLKASLLTADAGLITWADKLGIHCITTKDFLHLTHTK